MCVCGKCASAVHAIFSHRICMQSRIPVLGSDAYGHVENSSILIRVLKIQFSLRAQHCRRLFLLISGTGSNR